MDGDRAYIVFDDESIQNLLEGFDARGVQGEISARIEKEEFDGVSSSEIAYSLGVEVLQHRENNRILLSIIARIESIKDRKAEMELGAFASVIDEVSQDLKEILGDINDATPAPED
ncbi:MAG: hypothetical protein JW987_00620 [Anaerolineaceae bacterium]|nr:hypothetical protein [Anaerolineaceae bacterium]